MSNSKDLKKVNNDEFDPTRPDAGGADGSDALEESLPPTFVHIPNQNELSQAARQFFGGQLDEALIASIVAESEEVAHSTRKILGEHMRTGRRLRWTPTHPRRSLRRTISMRACSKAGSSLPIAAGI
ncbi:hypothetical protein [Paraburkholderia sp. EG304]|uniref:hypothetical protein n=1 Tax=Paraburkholderia sp. EG304 TaxID=3237015 RepID=UPI00397AC3A2